MSEVLTLVFRIRDASEITLLINAASQHAEMLEVQTQTLNDYLAEKQENKKNGD